VHSTSLGVRHASGLFLWPLSSDPGWRRETFALASRTQNLVCGFQVVFIATHPPAFVIDGDLHATVGAMALALTGRFNIAGSYIAGFWGGRFPKPILLSGICTSRLAGIATFLVFPLSEWRAYAFAIAMGRLSLGTVPLTSGTVATIFGVGNMSMLGGVVFLLHQVGAFLGGRMGGYPYHIAGSYTPSRSLSMFIG
jgi:hypothetical protein